MDLPGGLLQFILRNCMRQPTVKYVIFCHPYADSGDITIQEMFGKEKKLKGKSCEQAATGIDDL